MRWLCGRGTPKWLASWQAWGLFSSPCSCQVSRGIKGCMHVGAIQSGPNTSVDAALPPFSPWRRLFFKKKACILVRAFGFGFASARAIGQHRASQLSHVAGFQPGCKQPALLRSAPAPALLRCVHSVVPISKPAHPTAADPCRHRCRASNNARPDPALRCSPPRIAAFSFALAFGDSTVPVPSSRARHSHFGILRRYAQLIPATARPRRNAWIGVFGRGGVLNDSARSARCTAAEPSAGPRSPSRAPFGEPACGFACVASSTLPARAPRCAPGRRALHRRSSQLHPHTPASLVPGFLLLASGFPRLCRAANAPTMPRHLPKNARVSPRQIFSFSPLAHPCSNCRHSRHSKQLCNPNPILAPLCP
ncbi:hypothetical protein L1887_56882 [Cichorium endivia]|nr:hypothetical protein L1887_56882 [Cichorium endivia]